MSSGRVSSVNFWLCSIWCLLWNWTLYQGKYFSFRLDSANELFEYRNDFTIHFIIDFQFFCFQSPVEDTSINPNGIIRGCQRYDYSDISKSLSLLPNYYGLMCVYPLIRFRIHLDDLFFILLGSASGQYITLLRASGNIKILDTADLCHTI